MPKLKKHEQLFELPKDKLFAYIRKANFESLKIHFKTVWLVIKPKEMNK
jgi:hypothetical protein